ncbi:hypothetical protein Ccrd_020733 [Cynara cardunculus var. scolymus]|uniref:Uncharacterized protein n=1 Tax=Cynara cardunculus var. scolymus TaxID=59895 RepID=A0A124SES7_CYNCS|nr:hypothetical protein Ccrd_020733 [Cynara cardunculus var. scolymus]
MTIASPKLDCFPHQSHGLNVNRHLQGELQPLLLIDLWWLNLLVFFPGARLLLFRETAGLTILRTFKYGSTGMGLEALRYAYTLHIITLDPRAIQIAKILASSEILQNSGLQPLSQIGRDCFHMNSGMFILSTFTSKV